MSRSPKTPPAVEPRFTLTRGERCHFRIDLEVTADAFQRVYDEVARAYAGRIRMRGFRAGRTPMRVLSQQYGREIHDETVNRVARRAAREAIAAERLNPVSEVRLNDLKFRDGDTLVFNATFEALPEIPLGRLGGFSVERPLVRIPAGSVDRLLEDLRQRHATWRGTDSGTPERGDAVTVRVSTLSEDNDANSEEREYDLVLGQGQAIPGIEEAIRALEPGEKSEFDVGFPEDHPDDERAGTRHRLAIEVVSRRIAELPPLDDDFARSISDAEDLAQLRAFLETELTREAEAGAEEELRKRLFGMVIEANPFDVPDALIEDRLDAILKESAADLEDDQRKTVRERLRPGVEHSVRKDLLVERILDEHDLRAPESEVDEVVRKLAEEANESPSAVRARLRRDGGLDRIWSRITDNRLFAFLKEQSSITQEAPSAAPGDPNTGD